MFSGAHEFVVSGDQFNININHGSSGIDILLEASVPDAAVDAEARRYSPSCFPGTREQYIGDITSWATAGNNDQVPSIYWMKGPAGVGKSAIAQTCAKKIEEAGNLGAAFFFSVNGRSNHTRFFTTLAYQLSTVIPDYRRVLDSVVQNDRTLVTKAISSQFNNLIVKPLREVATQGKEVRKRTILIDGLDECSSTDAQCEIIEIIAASVRDRTTPFRWAIFSRAEARIAATFARGNVSPRTRSVLLPISRDCDDEIEIYLRSGFENILRRRNLPLSSSWPTNKAIKRLVDASAGLFAYSAAVLRFVDLYSYSGFKERLDAVLDAILQPNSQQPHSAFAELDVFYLLIMKQIPDDILPSAMLFLARMIQVGGFSYSWRVAMMCNMLGLSETAFMGVLNALQAVITFQEPPEPPKLAQGIDLTCSYFDVGQPLEKDPAVEIWPCNTHGVVSFHHKSFYDFLLDPARSSTFCVTVPAMHTKLFDCYVQRHLHFAQNYAIQGTRLVLVPGILSSSALLSRPYGNEFVDSYLMLEAFRVPSLGLSHHHRTFAQFLKDVPEGLLGKLAKLDYRKYLISNSCIDGLGLLTEAWAIGHRDGEVRQIAGTTYTCVESAKFDKLDLVAFLEMIKKLEKLQVIRPYHHHLPSIFASAYHSLSQIKPTGKRSGQYELGRGEKSVIWYWEFDTQMRYFHEFQTMNFSEAKKIYDTEKFKMWRRDWVAPS